MAIRIDTVLRETANGVLAEVLHGEQALVVGVVGDPLRLRAAVGETLVVEWDFGSVAEWRVLDDGVHGLFPRSEGSILARLKVRRLTQSDEEAVMDCVCEVGSESFAVDSEELGAVLAVGTQLELELAGVRCFPCWL